MFLVTKDLIDRQCFAGVLFKVVSIFEDIIIVLDLLRVGDKGHRGVAHYEFIVLEDVPNQAN